MPEVRILEDDPVHSIRFVRTPNEQLLTIALLPDMLSIDQTLMTSGKHENFDRYKQRLRSEYDGVNNSYDIDDMKVEPPEDVHLFIG